MNLDGEKNLEVSSWSREQLEEEEEVLPSLVALPGLEGGDRACISRPLLSLNM